jgi:cytochrome c oxidase cbb3-type subunit IV
MGTLRGLITLVLLLLFVALVVWLWRRGNKHRFDAAARMPLEDDAPTSDFLPKDETEKKL